MTTPALPTPWRLPFDGLLDAPTAEAAYRLVFPYLPQRPDHRLPRRPGPDHPGR
ncbi:hypothetical protein [Streptomyces lutosisoli]|uniref:Uncharacterized protein n=1 Tax=Streptomyces lutosisoli TaxID=2665721 RepID=A0ABW2VE98_9ACTN